MATKDQKVLFVTRNFPPLTGGMERLNLHAFLALEEEYEVILCGPKGCSSHAGGASCYEFSPAPPWKYAMDSMVTAIRASAKHKPDLVYAGSGLAAHAALCASKLVGAPCAVFLHGLDLITDNYVYQKIFLPAIRKCDIFFVNSRHTARLAVEKGIPSDKIIVIHPGVELPDFHQRPYRRFEFRKQFGLQDRTILLSVGRLSPRKGLVEFIDYCMPEIIRAKPEACLVVIGDIPKQGLGKHLADIKSRIQEAIHRNMLQQHVMLLGNTNDQTLSDAYFAADVFIFPALNLPGDVEGFGMVALEAAAHGLPTFAFNVGGINDAVAEGISGYLAQSDDYHYLSERIIRQLNNTAHGINPETCIDFASNYAWPVFSAKLTAACRNTLMINKG